MSEQQFQGTLASGGTIIATAQGIRILDPAGNQLASFGREVISGVGRDGQVVTIERHNDTIVTLTAGSITDAVGLEQYVRDSIVAPPPPPAGEPSTPPLAFDAFDDDSAPDEPARPQIISRPDPSDDSAPGRPAHDLPDPVPTAPSPPERYPSAASAPEPLPGRPEAPRQPPPEREMPPAAPPPADATGEDEKGGRRLWLWGCLGCGGLIILAIICIAVLAATGSIDVDELSGDEATSTPFEIIVTSDDADPSPTEETVEGDASPTPEGEGGDTPAPPPSGDAMNQGDSGTLNGVQVTFLESRTDTGGVFPPDPGNEYLILRFRVENTTAQPVFVSTLLQFELQDEAGETYDVALFADMEAGLDTEVAAGQSVEGEVAFEVPEGGGSYIVEFQDLLSESVLQWAVN